MTDTTLTIADVDEAGFPQAVLQASRTTPVVVDFWAPWCGPCHQLSPLLERVARRHAGEVTVVKVNVDRAPNLSRSYQVQGIPAVKAFRDGDVVAEFTGVQPETVVAQFFKALAPSAADRLLRSAQTAAPDRREPLLREALNSQPDHAGASVALATLLAERGDNDEALRLVARLPHDEAARRLAAELRLQQSGAGADLDDLRRRTDAGDPAARLNLGQALAASGNADQALPLLLEAVADPSTREEARTAVLELFAVLGDGAPLVRQWRPRLAAALF